jgi:hypothetical protein
MTALHMTVAVPAEGPAVVNLPQPLTAEALGRLEQALDATLGMLRRDLGGSARDAGRAEYASWLPRLRSSRP